MRARDFIEENFDYHSNLLEGYKLLNEINIPSKLKRFPYNIISLEATPTYKTISIKYIQGKNYYKTFGGSSNEIFVFLY